MDFRSRATSRETVLANRSLSAEKSARRSIKIARVSIKFERRVRAPA
jgi:hypothetical protein